MRGGTGASHVFQGDCAYQVHNALSGTTRTCSVFATAYNQRTVVALCDSRVCRFASGWAAAQSGVQPCACGAEPADKLPLQPTACATGRACGRASRAAHCAGRAGGRASCVP